MNPERRQQLEDEKSFLLQSLADLEREHDAGDVDDDDYVALKDSYTARAARLIAELEQGSTPTPNTRRRRNVAWVVLVVVLATHESAPTLTASRQHHLSKRGTTGESTQGERR